MPLKNSLNIFITDLPGIGGIFTNYMNLVKDFENSYILCFDKANKNRNNRLWLNISECLSLINSQIKNSRINLFISSPRGLFFFYFFNFYNILFKKNFTLYPIFLTYHQNEFSSSDLFSWYYRKLILSFGANNIWFMNSNCFEKHNLVVNKKLNPIFLNIVTARQISTTVKFNYPIYSNHLLTVGRLVDFKISYIENLIRYVSQRPKLKLTIVGDGPERKRIDELINTLPSNNIDLVGIVEYEKLKSYYKNCTFFVGMGTTLLEAANFNKLCVVAIAGEKKPLCYGWFHFLSDYNVGEQCFCKEYDLFDFLDSAFDLDRTNYESLLNKQNIHLSKFSIDETLSRLTLNLDKISLYKSNKFVDLFKVICFYFISFYAIIHKKTMNYSRYNDF